MSSSPHCTKTKTHQKPLSTAKPIKVAHVTDLHWLSNRKLSFWELLGKRFIGYSNLHFFGRKKYFSDQSRTEILSKLDEINPDLIICTGDLTSTGLDEEFDTAFEELRPFLQKYPFFLIPGNHDIYTTQNKLEMPIYNHFKTWMHRFIPESLLQVQKDARSDNLANRPTITHNNATHVLFTTNYNKIPLEIQSQYPNLSLFMYDNNQKSNINTLNPVESQDSTNQVLVIGLNPCRPTVIGSNGLYPTEQLSDLKRLLSTKTHLTTHANGNEINPFIVLATHYPVIDRSGYDYQAIHSHHGVENNHELLSVLDTALVKPGLIIHGHDHLGLAAGLSTQRYPSKESATCPFSATVKPMKVKNMPKLSNLNYNTNIILPPADYQALCDEIQRMDEIVQPTIYDLLSAYKNVYTTNSLNVLNTSIHNDLIQQTRVWDARSHIQQNTPEYTQNKAKFTEIVKKQYGLYGHNTIPLNLQSYLSNELKPFDIIKPMAALKEISQKSSKDIILPQIQQTADILDEIDSKSAENPYNHKVVIPIHNPGSGSLANTPMSSPKDWPKYAGFNIYNIFPRQINHNKSKLSQFAQNNPNIDELYASSDFYAIDIQHFQHTDKSCDQKSCIVDMPYLYPLF